MVHVLARRSVVVAAAVMSSLVTTTLFPSRTHAADAVYGFTVGGLDLDVGRAIAVDSTGNAYVMGEFSGTADLDPGPLTQNIAAQGNVDTFVARYGPAGGVRWALGIGGIGEDLAGDVAISGAYVYVGGGFSGTVDFDSGPAITRRTSSGSLDGFILKLDRATGSLVWVGIIKGPGEDMVRSVSVDGSGGIVVAGHFSQTADLDPSGGVASRTSAGITDVFIAKVHGDGTLGWARRVGGSGIDAAVAVRIDGSGNVFTAGYFSNTVDLDPGSAIHTRMSHGSFDVFALKLTSAGSFVWGASVGGSSTDYGNALSVTGVGQVYLAGNFQSTVDFDPGAGTQHRTSNGSYDMFVLKLKVDGTFAWVATAGGGGYESANGIAVGTDGVETTGSFAAAVDFDPSFASFTLSPAGSGEADVFVWTLSSAGGFVDAWRMGGTSGDVGFDIALSGSNVYTTGLIFGSGDYDPGAGTLTLTSHGDDDVFVSRVLK